MSAESLMMERAQGIDRNSTDLFYQEYSGPFIGKANTFILHIINIYYL